jgi:hypothetical protein
MMTISSNNINEREMAIPEKEMIKKCLGSDSRMRTLQEEKKLTIHVRDILNVLDFSGALAVKEFVKRNSEFLEKEVFHVDGFTTTVEYRPSKGTGKGKPQARIVVSLTN